MLKQRWCYSAETSLLLGSCHCSECLSSERLAGERVPRACRGRFAAGVPLHHGGSHLSCELSCASSFPLHHSLSAKK